MHEIKLKDEFLERWDKKTIQNMTLDEYVIGSDNYDDTFAYWLEYKTRELGSIAGWATKYGLYKQEEIKDVLPRGFDKDIDNYTWNKCLGKTRKEAFESIKNNILLPLIKNAKKGNFQNIENVDGLWPILKWKIAFLYQDFSKPIKILPIFAHSQLAEYLGIKDKDMIELYDIAIKKEKIKTVEDAFLFTSKVFGRIQDLITDVSNDSFDPPKRRKRMEGTKHYSAKEYNKDHLYIQNGLADYLRGKGHKVWTEWPSGNGRSAVDVRSEKNGKYVYYEVKPYPDVRACIREALGQLLEYMYFRRDLTNEEIKHHLPTKLIIVGKEKIDSNNERYLDLLTEKYKLPIEYRQFDLKRNKLIS